MYVALYRKYRPMDFTAVIGQEHITTTLKSEVQNGKVAHAYLFTGTRGTGKTTCARILAKAVNCLNPQNGEPCNECENCRAINDGTMLDVIEIDAASNTGVDNIRDIRDEAVYTPASGKKKVYIIDEVHMLSIGAFNALLKLLEEPPEHVMFILATTEAYKIAPTILSRCQRFDFKRITPANIAARLQYVCEQEQVPFTREGLFLIAKLGDGSMRDALSILDTCCGTGEELTYDYVAKTAGVTGRSSIYAMIRAMAAEDVGTVLDEVNAQYEGCKSVALLASELTSCMRDLMIIKAVHEPGKILGDYEFEMEELTALADGLSLERIVYSIGVLQELMNTLQRSQNQRIDFEVALLRLCQPKLDDGKDAILARLDKLEKQLASGLIAAPATLASTPQPAKAVAPKPKQAAQQPQAIVQPQATPAEAGMTPLPGWKETVDELVSVVGRVFGSLLMGQQAYLDGDTVYVVCTGNASKDKFSEPEIRTMTEKALAAKLGRHVQVHPIREQEFESTRRGEAPDADPFAMLLKNNQKNDHLQIED